MEKKISVIILLLLLCGCARQRNVACSRFDDENSLTLNIYALNDDIRTIEVNEVFLLPEQILADKQFSLDLYRQFDKSCHMEENRLIRSYGLVLDKSYSLSETIKLLQKQRYSCE